MALGLELKLKMSQQLVMTPQLQLAIRLLQMSNLDITDYLQEELDKNPLLERDRIEERQTTEAGEAAAEALTREKQPDEGVMPETLPEVKTEESGLKDDLPMDASWNDVYEDGSPGGGSYSQVNHSAEAPPIENTLTPASTLHDHLIWQLGPTALNDRERSLGMLIIDAIDDNGYMTTPLESLAEMANASVEEVEDALVMVQGFDPAGVGAQNLAECLRLQLKSLGLAQPPCTTLLDNLEDVARRDFRKLTRTLKISESELSTALSVIQSLNPKPGLAFGSDHAAYVIPDVFVKKVKGEWVVELNPDTQPKLRINQHYQDMMKSRGVSAQDKKYVAENSRSAQWLIKSLAQRSRTIYRVAESIVRFQEAFFEDGPEKLKPLILKDVADQIEVHESTVSRVTSGKYMHTPRGILEFKYFFSSSLSNDSGDAHSAEAVKFKIRKLIEEESARRPYSDEKLAKLLKEDGIQVARRTVAKYREAMGIFSSSRRKRL